MRVERKQVYRYFVTWNGKRISCGTEEKAWKVLASKLLSSRITGDGSNGTDERVSDWEMNFRKEYGYFSQIGDDWSFSCFTELRESLANAMRARRRPTTKYITGDAEYKRRLAILDECYDRFVAAGEKE